MPDRAGILASVLLFSGACFHLSQFAVDPAYHNVVHVLIGFQQFIMAFFFTGRKAPLSAPAPWKYQALAWVGTFLPALFQSGGKASLGSIFTTGLIVQNTAILVMILSVFSLGQAIGLRPANRGIRISGIYQWVRHPLYLGYLMFSIGIILQFPGVWNFFILVLIMGVHFFRIKAEEKVLDSDQEYQKYKERVIWKVAPWIY